MYDLNSTIFISIPLHIVRYLNRYYFDCILFYPWYLFCLQMWRIIKGTASSVEAEDKWHEARGSPDWLKVVALPLMREERVSVSQRRLLLCRIAASYLCGLRLYASSNS